MNASAGANTNWHGGRGVRMEIGAYVACMAVHVTYVHPPTLTKYLNLDHAYAFIQINAYMDEPL